MKLFISILTALFLLNANAQKETAILFIGNSYTFYNDMPGIVQKLGQANNLSVFVDTVVQGGKNLKYHSEQAKTYEKIKSRDWDYIVIQGHSSEFAQPESVIKTNSIPYLTQIIDSINVLSPCSNKLFYMTWGYKNGNSKWAPINTYGTMQDLITKEYTKLGKDFHIGISPVGDAWQKVRSQYKNLNLYDPDLHHPSLEGSYLSACTFYSVIFKTSPFNNSAEIELPKEDRNILEGMAYSTLMNNATEWNLHNRNPEIVSGFDLHSRRKTIELYNRTTNASSYAWCFGDGCTSEEESPVHTYQKKGTYSITLVSSDNCHTTEITRSITID